MKSEKRKQYFFLGIDLFVCTLSPANGVGGVLSTVGMLLHAGLVWRRIKGAESAHKHMFLYQQQQQQQQPCMELLMGPSTSWPCLQIQVTFSNTFVGGYQFRNSILQHQLGCAG